MANTLQSPGVQVSIIDESFYTPAAPGTVPLIFVASAANKTNPSGVTAPGTVPSAAGTVYTITSQRDLTDTFGVPHFITDASGNPVHGSELNEYGLQAAYSLLGVSSQAFIVRADLDLASLTAEASAPTGAPADGSYWFDTGSTTYGVFEWNSSTGAFANKTPLVIDNNNYTITTVSGAGTQPKPSFGTVGSYAIVTDTSADMQNAVWFKNSDGNWVEVGSLGEENFASNSYQDTFVSTAWSTSWPALTSAVTTGSQSGGNLTLNGLQVTIPSGTVATLVSTINETYHTKGIGAKLNGNVVEFYVDATANPGTGGGQVGQMVLSADSSILTALGIENGTYSSPAVFVGPHTQYPDFSANPSGSVYVKTTSPNGGANWAVKKFNATTGAFDLVPAPIYANKSNATYNLDKVGGGANIPVGTLFIESNYDHGDNYHSTLTNQCRPALATFAIQRRTAVAPTTITSTVNSGTVSNSTVTVAVSVPGQAAFSTGTALTIAGGTDALVQAINASSIPNLSAVTNSDGSISIVHATGGDIAFKDPSNVLYHLGFTAGTTANFYAAGDYEPNKFTQFASNWAPLSYTASSIAPSNTPADGQLWYDAITDQIDILYHNGQEWTGYGNAFPSTDPNGPIVSATAPTTQSDGVTAVVNGDIWVSTAVANLEEYGQQIYVYNGNTLSWVLQDPTDHTSPNGWIFADARWATSGQAVLASSISDLRASNYVDPDAPDPAEYPRGTRLWNLRRSGFNIKKYVKGYIDINSNNGFNIRVPNDPMNGSNDTTPYNADRWVSVSPNDAKGVGTFGRHAQRAFVVKSLKSLIDSNQKVRDTDTLVFNLIACPGYPETIANMVGLNADRAQTAFVVGDTPFRLQPTGTALKAYGINSNGSLDNDENGLLSHDDYMAVWYPSGYTNDLSGNYIVVPPSHMMLRTIAESDQKSYPWFAPAGIRRGVIDNATSVGYIDATGEFQSTALPQSIRDVMAQNGAINPIANITGAGIVAFGQYTRASAASSLDRINVARLVAYLRRQLDVLARPYLFEPNDKITRNEIKNAVQSLLLELVGQRALYDFIVVCDESNNTPDRIDRSELWVDVAIEPVKAVEFIYIPVRLVNTGSIAAGTYTLA
jgi:Phage tail sheath C-terminal domain